MSNCELKIRRAKESDWKLIHDIYTSCAEWLSRQGWKHWERFSHLNIKERIIQRIKEKDVYILFLDKGAVGTITLNYKRPHYHKEYSFWNESSAPAVYVSRLGVYQITMEEDLEVGYLNLPKIRRDKRISITFD